MKLVQGVLVHRDFSDDVVGRELRKSEIATVAVALNGKCIGDDGGRFRTTSKGK